jgi:hypothetical protein
MILVRYQTCKIQLYAIISPIIFLQIVQIMGLFRLVSLGRLVRSG